MKNIKNKIAALVCGIALLVVGSTMIVNAANQTQGSISCYYIHCSNSVICIDNGSAGPPTAQQYDVRDWAVNMMLCGYYWLNH